MAASRHWRDLDSLSDEVQAAIPAEVDAPGPGGTESIPSLPGGRSSGSSAVIEALRTMPSETAMEPVRALAMSLEGERLIRGEPTERVDRAVQG